MISSPRVLAGPDSEVLAQVLELMVRGQPFAVLDRTWPARWRDQLSHLVESTTAPPAHLVAFTSGSAGHPRGILRSFESWDASVDPVTVLTGLDSQDVIGVPGPLASTLYLYGAWHAARLGAQLVTSDEWSRRCREVTAVHVVPGLLPSLLEQRAVGLLPQLKLVISGGDRLGARLRAQCAAADLRVLEYYGSAETSFVLVDLDGQGLDPFPGCRVQVRAGRLWVASPYLSGGYLAGVPGPLVTGNEGFVSVGDRALLLPGGRYEVLGRDGAITVGGHTVHLADVERAVSSQRGVEEAVVVGVPHERLGQVGVAVYRGAASPESLRAPLRVLPSPARPLHWLRLDALPHTTAGKPDRRAIGELARERFG